MVGWLSVSPASLVAEDRDYLAELDVLHAAINKVGPPPLTHHMQAGRQARRAAEGGGRACGCVGGCRQVRAACRPGCSSALLHMATKSILTLTDVVNMMDEASS